MINQQFVRSVKLHKEKQGLESYVAGLAILRDLDSLEMDKPVTFFIGENGTGKSTLLEAIAVECGFNPEGGSRNFNFSSRETHSNLNEYITVVKGFRQPKDGFFLRAESFYNVATEVDKVGAANSYGGKSLHEQSHGESFMSLILNRFRGNGIYILDEPEAALSPSRQLALLCRIHELVNKGSQFIIATHSPILMAYPEADIYLADYDQKITLTEYKETEHYKLTRDFINHPEQMLTYLFKE
ncbi:MAG TPA: AAA family ATPase [Anaerovoracaceae bacterium]|nr:AAA family ATPase [Anaerovoracaceae bacterium]